ncbi:unnamed protein product [Adineta ricciae]|uniref:Replication-associated protein n=1 Tax=Adineta ricciae TaxID=249248 RepID=A0A815ZBD1_ADIRI|nr:unnamed protein product [Adineta ricciae]
MDATNGQNMKSVDADNQGNENNDEERSNSVSQEQCISTTRSATLDLTSNNASSYGRTYPHNTSNLHVTPSTSNIQPRSFQASTTTDMEPFVDMEDSVNSGYDILLQELEAETHPCYHHEKNCKTHEEEEEEDEDHRAIAIVNHTALEQQCGGFYEISNEQLDEETEQLRQLIVTQRPMNDEIAEHIFKQLNFTPYSMTDMIADTSPNGSSVILDNASIDLVSRTPSIILSLSQPPLPPPPPPSSSSSSSSSSSTPATTTTTTTGTRRPYPPMNQTGLIDDHDRPHADYGHLNRQTIAQEFHFNLVSPSATVDVRKRFRLNTKSLAITSWTNVAKERVMDHIKEELDVENIQYICIGEEISRRTHRRHLHIQIILKNKINKKTRFLDSITRTHCNYQVTRNDRAWNEYIKKGGNYIEFNTFKSTTKLQGKRWPPSSLSSSSSISIPSSAPAAAAAPAAAPSALAALAPPTPNTTARGQVELRRQYANDVAREALTLAETSIDSAMDFVRTKMPREFLHNSTWYLHTFKYVHLRVEQDLDEQRRNHKEHTWPDSFANCTPALREVVTRWLNEEFIKTSRAKCLILIGGTGTGKTSFAKSLPGQNNYFQGRWRLDTWKDSARYLIFDDIPWDKFEQLGFPPKKALLTQNGTTIVTDKYKPCIEINIQQPAIVLLNAEDAGSLIAEARNTEDQEFVGYWQHRAIIYQLGPDEYFHRPDHDGNDSPIDD